MEISSIDWVNAFAHANRIVNDSNRIGLTAVYGGGVRDHLPGKLGELKFLHWCIKNNIQVNHMPLREDYTQLSDYDDFIVNLRGEELKIELKSRIVKAYWDRGYELWYDKHQYDKKPKHNYIVGLLLIDDLRFKCDFSGWISAKEVAKFPTKDIYDSSRGVTRTVYKIHTSQLKSPQILLNIKNNGSGNNKKKEEQEQKQGENK